MKNCSMQCRLSGRHCHKRDSRLQSGADGQLSPKLTFRLKDCNGAGCTSAMQRKPVYTSVRLGVAQYSPAYRSYKFDDSMLRRPMAQHRSTCIQGLLLAGSPTCLASSGKRWSRSARTASVTCLRPGTMRCRWESSPIQCGLMCTSRPAAMWAAMSSWER